MVWGGVGGCGGTALPKPVLGPFCAEARPCRWALQPGLVRLGELWAWGEAGTLLPLKARLLLPPPPGSQRSQPGGDRSTCRPQVSHRVTWGWSLRVVETQARASPPGVGQGVSEITERRTHPSGPRAPGAISPACTPSLLTHTSTHTHTHAPHTAQRFPCGCGLTLGGPAAGRPVLRGSEQAQAGDRHAGRAVRQHRARSRSRVCILLSVPAGTRYDFTVVSSTISALSVIVLGKFNRNRTLS